MIKKHLLFFHTLFTFLLLCLSFLYIYARLNDEYLWTFAPQPFIYFILPISFTLLLYWLLQQKDFYEESIYYTIGPYLSTILLLSFGYFMVKPIIAVLFIFPIWLLSIKIYLLIMDVRGTTFLFKSPFSFLTNSFLVLTLIHLHQLADRFFPSQFPLFILFFFLVAIIYLMIQSIRKKDFILTLPILFFYSSYALTKEIPDFLKVMCAFGLGISLFILYTLLKRFATNSSIQLN